MGDFNGDGRDDLLCHDLSTGDRRARYANPEGNYRSICSTQSSQGDGELQPIDVHFVVLSDPRHSTVTDRHAATSMPGSGVPRRGIPTSQTVHLHPLTGATINQNSDHSAYFRAEVDVINEYFYDDGGNSVCDGGDCFSFRYSSHTLFDEIDASSCPELYKFGNPPNSDWSRDCEAGSSPQCGTGSVQDTKWSRALRKAIDACDDPKLHRRGVLNFYVMDACNWPLSNANCGARTISNGLQTPHFSVAMAYERLLRGSATGDRHIANGVEQHEIGHVFGLGHTWDCSSSTDPMEQSAVPKPFCPSLPEATSYPGATPSCSVTSSRTGGFNTAAREWHESGSCTSLTTVNQIDTLVSKAREAQVDWYCGLQ